MVVLVGLSTQVRIVQQGIEDINTQRQMNSLPYTLLKLRFVTPEEPFLYPHNLFSVGSAFHEMEMLTQHYLWWFVRRLLAFIHFKM